MITQDRLPNETGLIEAFRRERTASTFEPLVRLHVDRVRGVLLNLVMNPEDAEDLAQDTWVIAFEQFDRFAGVSAFSTWVCGIAVKKGLQFLRTQRRRSELLEENAFRLQPSSSSTEFPLTDKEEHMFLTDALARLPDAFRAVITLSAIEEMPPAEIAKVCGCSIPTVYWRLHTARKRLSKILKGQYAK